jgi:hypothetical protein
MIQNQTMRFLKDGWQRGIMLFAFVVFCLTNSQNSIAQNWTIPTCSASNSVSYGPMYSTSTVNATSRYAVIYPSSQLAGVTGQTLTSAYFQRYSTSGSMAGTPNFKIYLKEVTATDWGSSSLTWATEIAGATLVYDGNPASIVGSASGWKGFPFTSNFTYSGSQNLAVFLEYSNSTASSSITWYYESGSTCVSSTNSNTTKYITNTSGTPGATLSTSNYRRPVIGFDYTLPGCSGTPSAGTLAVTSQALCTGSTPATLTTTGYTALQSGISYQWEESDDNGVNDQWTAAVGGTGSTTPSFVPPAFSGNAIYYRLSVTCANGGGVDYSSSTVINPAGTPATAATAITFPSVTNSGMTIGWTNGNGGRRFVVINTTNNFTDPVDGTTGPATAASFYNGSGEQVVYDGTGSSVAVSGLSCNSTYYVRVYEYQRCGSAAPYNYWYNTFQSTANPSTVNTIAPSTATLSATNDFTGFTGTNLSTAVPGWYEGVRTTSSGTTPIQANPNTINSNWTYSTLLSGTTARINLYGSTKNDWIISPVINLSSPSRVKFKAAITGYATANTDPDGMQGTDDKVHVLISTDGCGATWTPLYTFSDTNTTTLSNVLTDFTFSLAAYTGQNVQIAFEATDGPVDNLPDYDFHIGSIAIEPIPACDAPTALTVPSVTATGATVNWTASLSAPSNGYDYYVGTTNTAPTSTTAATGSVATGTSGNITGLNPVTTYYVWVRSNCGGGGTSGWSGPVALTTACAAYNAPFAETFNTATLPSCWSNTGAELWQIDQNGAGGPDNGAETATDHTGGGYFVWADDSSPNNVDVTLTSPVINISSLTTPRLRFYFWSYDNQATPQNGSLVVKANNGSGWVTIDSIYQNYAAQWNERTISLSSFTGNVQFQFIVNENAASNFYDDILLDDIYVENTPTCLTPASATTGNVTSNSAELSWTSAVGQYEVEYGVGNFTQGTGTKISVSSTPYVLTGLSPVTGYSYFVRAICSVGDTSLWSSRVSFTTPCPPSYTIPFTESFASYVPSCWTEADGYLGTGSVLTGTSSSWAVDGWLNSGTTGATKNQFSGSTDKEWLITPSVNLGSGSNAFNLEFDVAFVATSTSTAQALGSDDTLALVISTDNGATWSLGNVLTLFTASNSLLPGGVQHVSVPLGAYSGLVKFGFYASEGVIDDFTTSGTEGMIDNFTINAGTPLAIKLTDITAVNAGNKNRVDWSTANEAAGDYFELERSADGIDFIKLSNVTAKGTGSNYSYWDENSLNGINYYRLKMIGLNGGSSYSKTVSAKVNTGAAATVSVYPNPVRDVVTVKVTGGTENGNISLVDLSGRTIRSMAVSAAETAIDMSSLSPGIYFIKYTDKNVMETIKINKQ